MTGRQLKLNDNTVKKLVTCIRKGLTVEKTAELSGISESTLNSWKQSAIRAEAQLSANLPLTGKDHKFLSFLVAIKRAEAEFEEDAVQRIREAGRGGAIIRTTVTTRRNGDVVEDTQISRPEWQALAFLLERKYPDRYGRRERRDIDLTSGGKAVKGYIGFSPEEWDKQFADEKELGELDP